jgi:hypothetical protein
LVIGLYELLGNPTTYLIEPLGHSVLHVWNVRISIYPLQLLKTINQVAYKYKS